MNKPIKQPNFAQPQTTPGDIVNDEIPQPKPKGFQQKQQAPPTKIGFTLEETEAMMDALQKDEEVIMAAKVRNGLAKLQIYEEYVKALQERQQ